MSTIGVLSSARRRLQFLVEMSTVEQAGQRIGSSQSVELFDRAPELVFDCFGEGGGSYERTDGFRRRTA